jgi:hypothetical protein
MDSMVRETVRQAAQQFCALAAVAALALALAVTGCNQKGTGDAESAAEIPASSAAATATDGESGALATNGTPDALSTNEEPAVAHGFGKQLQESPFAAADPALKESFARALLAYNIGDYPRAASELKELPGAYELDAEQAKAVKALLKKTLGAAPELAASNAAPAAAQAETFALASETEPPFSTADASVREGYNRAKAAFDIENYQVALSELQSLATNAQLNWQQKYAVQTLLDKTPQTVAAPTR